MELQLNFSGIWTSNSIKYFFSGGRGRGKEGQRNTHIYLVQKTTGSEREEY